MMGDRNFRTVITSAIESVSKQLDYKIDTENIDKIHLSEVTKCLTKIDKDFLNTKGQWFDLDNIGMPSVISCISMFHPRYILAHPKSKKESWIDLKSVREKLS